MNKSDISDLREVFRERMRNEDFCIGEAQIEKLFRELLEEPEPIMEEFNHGPHISSQQISDIISEFINKTTIEDLFNRKDNEFFDKLKGKIEK